MTFWASVHLGLACIGPACLRVRPTSLLLTVTLCKFTIAPPPPSPAVLFEHATKAGAHIHTSFDVASTIQHPDNTLSIRSMCGASDGPFDLVVDCSGRHSKLVDATPDNIAVNEPYPYAALWGVRV
jgi:hypothetical protein